MRGDELTLKLACGAELTLRVWVDPANCRLRDGGCPSAEEIMSMIWMALQDERAPSTTRE